MGIEDINVDAGAASSSSISASASGSSGMGGSGGAGAAGGSGGAGGGMGGSGGSGGMPQDPCAMAVEVTFADMHTFSKLGTTSGTGKLGTGTKNNCTQAKGPEQVYHVKVPTSGILTATLPRSDADFDTVLYARRTNCFDSTKTILCNDQHNALSPGVFGGEIISFPVKQGEDIDIIVDGFEEGDQGNFLLSITLYAGLACDSVIPIMLDPGVTVSLMSEIPGGSDNNFCANCGGISLCAGLGKQIMYRLEGAANVKAKITVADTDTVLYTRSTCTGTQLGCNDASGNGGDNLTVPLSPMTPTFVFVDRGANTPVANATLTISP